MRVLVTGGAGFIASELVRALLVRGSLSDSDNVVHDIKEIVLLDVVEAPKRNEDSRVSHVVGDVFDIAALGLVLAKGIDSVFHLAAVVSGQAEANLSLGLRVNLDATRTLLDAVAATNPRAKFMFASSGAVFGGPAAKHVTDETIPAPQSSYGTQKLCCELLVSDYHRRGLVDGRPMRFPTVAVRPGAPNAANSSFISSIIREPVAGKPAICPVAADVPIALISPSKLVEAIIRVHEAPTEAIGWPRTVTLPAIEVTVASMLAALREYKGDAIAELVRFERNEKIEGMVLSWPATIKSARAKALGIEPDESADAIVSQYLASVSAARQAEEMRS